MPQRTRCCQERGSQPGCVVGRGRPPRPGKGDRGRGGKGWWCLYPGRHFLAGQDFVIDLATAGDVGLYSLCVCVEKALQEVEVRILGRDRLFLCWKRQRKWQLFSQDGIYLCRRKISFPWRFLLWKGYLFLVWEELRTRKYFFPLE